MSDKQCDIEDVLYPLWSRLNYLTIYEKNESLVDIYGVQRLTADNTWTFNAPGGQMIIEQSRPLLTSVAEHSLVCSHVFVCKAKTKRFTVYETLLKESLTTRYLNLPPGT